MGLLYDRFSGNQAIRLKDQHITAGVLQGPYRLGEPHAGIVTLLLQPEPESVVKSFIFDADDLHQTDSLITFDHRLAQRAVSVVDHLPKYRSFNQRDETIERTCERPVGRRGKVERCFNPGIREGLIVAGKSIDDNLDDFAWLQVDVGLG